jgi:predicted amidohydrolase
MTMTCTKRIPATVAWGFLSLFAALGTHAHARADEQPASTKATVRIGGIVLKWIRSDKEANYRRIEPMIRKAAANGAKIICTTECFLDGYAIADKELPLDDYRALGEVIPTGKYYQRLAALAAELKVHLIAGMTEADGEARYNTVVFLGPDGKLVGKYHKQRIGHEDDRNRAGNVSSVFQTPYGNVGLFICADRTFPDVVKNFCSNGANFLICASGGSWGVLDNDLVVQSRSRENKKYLVFVHPAEFLVTAPDGTVAKRHLLGHELWLPREAVGGERDKNDVFYFDLPIGELATGSR